MSIDLIDYGLSIARSMDLKPPSSAPKKPSAPSNLKESRLNAAWRVVALAPRGINAMRMTCAAWMMEAQAAPNQTASDAAQAAATAISQKLAAIGGKAKP